MPDTQEVRMLLAAAFIHAKLSEGCTHLPPKLIVQETLGLVDELLDQTIGKDQ